MPELTFDEDHMGDSVQLSDATRVVVWGKEGNAGGAGSYFMPEDPKPPYMLDIFGGRPYGGGDITLKISTGATAAGHRFHQSNNTDNAVAYVPNALYTQYILKNTGGRKISCVYIPDVKRWLVCH